MPLQFRRGPDSDRLTITPSVAEPVFTTDTKRLFIGDGSTAGGIEISGSVDSAATIALIDSAYVLARAPAQTTADFPDSAGVNTLIDTRVNASFINALTIDADTLGGQAGSYYLNYNNFTNTPTIPTLSTDFVDSAEGRKLISVTDAGGDGSLAYNNSTGVLTYTGPSAAEVRAHFSGGTGVTYTSGTGAIAIGQAVGTTDSVTFGGLYVSGNLEVNGTTTTINSTTLTVDDKNIVLADGAANANAADSGGITVAGANAQLFYKSTTDAWNFNKDLAMGGNDVSGVGRLTATGAISTTDSAIFGGNGSTGGVKIDDGAITIRTGTGSVAYVDFYCETNNAHRVRLKSPSHSSYSGNPDVVLPTSSGTLALTSDIPTNNNTLTNGAGYITASSTETLTNKSGNISMFTNDANYLDSTTVTGVITQAYVNSLGITAGLDSALVSQLVDSAYVQLRQSGGAITVQEEGVSLATSATTLNFVGSNVTASGTGATKTITITGGSGGAGGSGISRADFFHYTATSGQTSFTGADDDGQTLSYTPARAAVYLNGILLRDSADYTSTSGDAIVLGTGADSNDIVTIINQGGLDSSVVTTIVDSAYVSARAGSSGSSGLDSASALNLFSVTTADPFAVTVGADSASFDLLNDVNYTSSPDLSTGLERNGLLFSDDGGVMYIADDDGIVRRYTLSTAYDPESYTETHSNYIDLGLTNQSLMHRTTGGYFLSTNYGGDIIRLFTSSDGFDTFSYVGNTTGQLDTTDDGLTSPISAQFNADGTVLWVYDGHSSNVGYYRKYTLSTAYNLSTATYQSSASTEVKLGASTASGSSSNGEWFQFAFNNNGKIVFEYDGDNLALFRLATAYDLSSAGTLLQSYNKSSFIGSITNSHTAWQWVHTSSKNAIFTMPRNYNNMVEIPLNYTGSEGTPANPASLVYSADSGVYTYTPPKIVDSSDVISLIDSAYVAARAGGATGGTDSAAVIALIDSAYVQARQSSVFTAGTVNSILVDGNSASDTTYNDTVWTAGSDTSGDGYNQGGGLSWNSTNGRVTVSEGGLYEIKFHSYLTSSGDGANHNQRWHLFINGTNKIPAFIHKYMATNDVSVQVGSVTLPLSANDYIQVKGATGTAWAPRIYGGSGHTFLQVVKQENGVLDTGIDSSTITSLIDSDYIQLRQSAAGGGGTDSAAVISLIDSAHINARIGSAATLTFTPDVKHARLSMSGDESIDAGAWRKVDNLTVRDVDTSTGNALSNTSNARLVIPAGVTKVRVMAGLDTSDVAGQVIAEIYHYNSSGSLQTTRSAKNDTDTSGGDTTVTYTSIVDVSQGDYFQLHAYAQDAGTLKATKNTFLEIQVLEGSILNTVIGSTIQLSDLSNVDSATPTNGQALVWDSANQYWEPGTVASSGGTDSAAVIALIDSSYVQARQSATAPATLTADIFSYTASNAQTAFSGADNNNKTLAYTPDNVNVFLNGILLVDSDDYTATSGSLVTLVSAASAGDNIQITGYNTTGAATTETAFSQFTYTATSGQTAFTGAGEEGTALQYTSNAQVYLNGILLKDSDDYTRTSSSVLTLTDAADSADIIQIHDFNGVRVSSNLINKNYEFTADSGQTTFSGADNGGTTLAYQSGYIQVFLNGILLREADYTASNGTSVVLAEGADSGNTLTISKYGYGTTSSSTVATWTERSTTATASAGEKLFIDCSSGVVTVTLPASPDMGSEVRVIDATGNAATNNITIGRNGSKINGADSDLTLDINRAAIGLVYYNTAQGWILMER